MSRAEDRRKLKSMKKKVNDLSVSEFEKIIDESAGKAFEEGYEKGFQLGLNAIVSQLRKLYGFGPKRIRRLLDEINK